MTSEIDRDDGQLEQPHWSTCRSIRAENTIYRAGHSTSEFLGRHLGGEWGNVSSEQIERNNTAMESDDGLIISCFRTDSGDEIYLVTDLEAHRTEILLADEYPETLAEIREIIARRGTA